MDSGVREKGTEKEQFKRKEAMRFHGFRKLFNTMLNQAGVKPAIKEMLLGHRVGLESSYLRPSDSELISEYLKAVDLLTVSEEKQLLQQVQNLKIQVSDIDVMKKQYLELKFSGEVEQHQLSDALVQLADRNTQLQKRIEALENKNK